MCPSSLAVSRSLFAVAVITVVATACPGRGPAIIGEGEGEGEGEGDACTPVTLGPVSLSFQDDVSTHYEAPITSVLDGVAPDFLVLQFFNYNERIDDLGIGTFPLDDATNDNYGHCAECLLVFTDQIDENAVPVRVFFQQSGSITLTKNPRVGADLFGSINDLVLVESTIGGEDLSSAPVPSGECLDVGDVALDLKFVPDQWICAPALYNAGDGVCDCECGTPDNDCFPNFGDPAPTTAGCDADQACVLDVCRDTCDAFAGEGCAGGGVCAFGFPDDVCFDNDVVDAAGLGEACSADDFNHQWCAVDATIPLGVCDFDLDGDGTRLCRARCESEADCDASDDCFAVVFDNDGNPGAGFCDTAATP